MKPQLQKTSINLSSKPKISISLDPVLEAYCKYIFKKLPNQKEIIVLRHHDLGKLIHANILTSEFPIRRPFKENPVTFILPINKENQHALKNHFLYVSRWGEQKIRDAIEYEFKAWVRHKFEKGYNVKKWDQKTIIEAILRGLNIRNTVANYDTIKKIDYRYRRGNDEIRFEELIKD